MKMIEASIADIIEQLKRETGSDIAILGSIDASKRKLRWSYANGSISERTLHVEQKPSAGLSGTAIRSARLASTNAPLTDAERFKLGEPILLAEQLRIAASIPILTNRGIYGVLLIGRRSEQIYSRNELEFASQLAKDLSFILL
jgi:nitrogen regulatory protein A